MKFFTWNSQGDFTTPEKGNVVKNLFLTHGCSIGFIQEGGTDKALRAIPAGVKVYSGTPVGAKQERCTNYVLVNTNVINGGEKFDIFNVIGGGVAGRTAAAIRLGNAIYVSWHSLSGACNADTSALLDACKQMQGVNTIVIGGDFNTDPDEIDKMIAYKGASRSISNFKSCWVEKSGIPTHASLSGTGDDLELDFFVVLRKTAQVQATKVDVLPAFESDHDPVIMDIQL